MSVPVSATEELVVAVRALVNARRDPSLKPSDFDAIWSDLAIALGTWDHDAKMPEAATADRVEVQVPVPAKMSDADILDRAADILEDGLGDIKGFMRTANVKTLIRMLPELARKLRREKRKGTND